MVKIYLEMHVDLDVDNKSEVACVKEYLNRTPGLIQYDFVKRGHWSSGYYVFTEAEVKEIAREGWENWRKKGGWL